MAKTLTFGPYGQMREGHPLRERRPPFGPFLAKSAFGPPLPFGLWEREAPFGPMAKEGRGRRTYGPLLAIPYGRGPKRPNEGWPSPPFGPLAKKSVWPALWPAHT